ncbi:MAG: hypothetical protein QOE41_329 [Mycobacterium sp.]|jgi:hypothetical protein|nr:hypothetical protein [Mycobacterium sp.]
MLSPCHPSTRSGGLSPAALRKLDTRLVGVGNLACVPEGEPSGTAEQKPPVSTPETTRANEPGPVFSAFGIASAVLGLLSVAAIVLAAMMWSSHRETTDTLSYQVRAAQAAVDWTGVLINLNKDNVDSSLQKLHDGTVGELNNDFESTMQPYRSIIQRLQSKTTGQINSVSIEALHHNLDAQPTGPPPPPVPDFASRTDTVLIVATSVSQNTGAQPQTVHWNLRLGVSEVNGKLLISRLEPIH